MIVREFIESKKRYFVEIDASEEHVNRYAFAAEEIERYYKNPVVLDIACGRGFGAWILSRISQNVVAADIDVENIAFAKKHFFAENVDYIVADAATMPFAENTFSAAVSLETIEHLNEAEQKKFLSGLQRRVKDGGVIIISTPDHEIWNSQAMHQHDHKRELTKKEFLELLRRFFSDVELYGIKKIKKDGNFLKKALRLFLIIIKRADIFGLRYKITGSNLRKSLDKKTAPWEENIWPFPLVRDETAADLIAVCRNRKH